MALIRPVVLLLLGASLSLADGTPRVPTIDDLLLIKSAFGSQISPDGKWVAYGVNETDFKQDAFITQIWLANTGTGEIFQLTRGDKSSSNPQWSPDGTCLAFTSNRVGDKDQIFLIRPDGGEAIQLTKSEAGVGGFVWSRDGKSIAFTATDAQTQAQKDRKEHYDDYDVVRKEYSHSHIWTLDLADALKAPAAGKQRTHGKEFSVNSCSWSPDGTRIAFSATLNPDLINGGTADIYVLTLANDEVKKIVSQPGPDNGPRWSPDGKQLVFTSAMGNASFFARNSRLAVVAAEGGSPRSISDGFDENPGLVDWNADGIYFSGSQKTASHLFRADPVTGRIMRITGPDSLMAQSFSLTAAGWLASSLRLRLSPRWRFPTCPASRRTR